MMVEVAYSRKLLLNKMMMINIELLNKIFTYFIGISRKSIAKERIRDSLYQKGNVGRIREKGVSTSKQHLKKYKG